MTTRICRSLASTRRLAREFARTLKQTGNAIVLFSDAPMGSGKTTFVSSVVSSLDPAATAVTSPTFTIINQYAENIFHIDLYRIENEHELENTDFNDIVNSGNFVFIEWSSLIKRNFEGKVFHVSIEPIDDNTRKFTIKEAQ